jgi:hypothetical protein
MHLTSKKLAMALSYRTQENSHACTHQLLVRCSFKNGSFTLEEMCSFLAFLEHASSSDFSEGK